MIVLVAAAIGVSAVLSRRRTQAPVSSGARQAPARLNRDDFEGADCEWLVAIFTAATCNSCAETVARASILASDAIAVAEVEVTPDLKQARVFVSVIGDDSQRDKVLRLLGERRGLLQSRLGKRVVLKYTPQLVFSADDSVERGVHILSLLDQVEEEATKNSGDEEVIEDSSPRQEEDSGEDSNPKES